MQGEEYLENVSFKDSRVTYISQDGTVLFDSEADTVSMDNHSHREEVVEAAKQGTGEAYRVSNTLSEMTIYYALRLSDETILRVSTTQYSVLALIYQLIQPVLIILVLMIILSVIFADQNFKEDPCSLSMSWIWSIRKRTRHMRRLRLF